MNKNLSTRPMHKGISFLNPVDVDGDYYMIKKGVKSSDDSYVKYKNTYLKLSSDQLAYNGKNSNFDKLKHTIISISKPLTHIFP